MLTTAPVSSEDKVLGLFRIAYNYVSEKFAIPAVNVGLTELDTFNECVVWLLVASNCDT